MSIYRKERVLWLALGVLIGGATALLMFCAGWWLRAEVLRW